MSVDYGTSQKFMFTPNTGYSISQVLVDNVPELFTANTYTLSSVATNHTVAVSFIPSYIITASAGKGGTINPTGSVSVNRGSAKNSKLHPTRVIL